MRRRFRFARDVAGFALLFSIGAADLIVLSHLRYLKSDVENISGSTFFTVENPPGFIQQNSHSSELIRFRRIAGFPEDAPCTIDTALRIGHWVHVQQPAG